MPEGVNNYANTATRTGYDSCSNLPSASDEFNSPILQEAEQEGSLVLRKPPEPAKLHALLNLWGPTHPTFTADDLFM